MHRYPAIVASTHLLAIGGAHDLAINHRRLARLGVRVARAHRVDLDVRAARGHKLLVDVRVVAAHAAGVVGQVLGRLVAHLAEHLLHAAAHGVGVVDPDVVVVAEARLLHKGLADLDAVLHAGRSTSPLPCPAPELPDTTRRYASPHAQRSASH